MIIDNYLMMADEQSVGTGTSLQASTSYIDTLARADDYAGCIFCVNVNTAITSTGAANVTFVLQSDSTTAFSAAVTHCTTGAIAKASLTAGYLAKLRIPTGTKRYIRAAMTVDTTTASAGAVSMFIVKDADVNMQLEA